MGQNPFRHFGSPPPFKRGDLVTPKRGKNFYAKWRHGEFRPVLEVKWDETDNTYGSWVLVLFNPLKATAVGATSKYNPANFTTESYIMPAPLGHRQPTSEELGNYHQHLVGRETAKYFLAMVQGPELKDLGIVSGPFDTREQAHASFESIPINNTDSGNVWHILKSVMKFEVLEPKPPIRVTEFR